MTKTIVELSTYLLSLDATDRYALALLTLHAASLDASWTDSYRFHKTILSPGEYRLLIGAFPEWKRLES